MTESKPKCPVCKSSNVAEIFYGLPADMEWYLKARKEKKIVGGGCCVSWDDPKWACNDCHHRWGGLEFD